MGVTYCEIMFICWKFHLLYFVGKAIFEFKIRTQYLFNLVILRKILESTNSSVHEHVHSQATKFSGHYFVCAGIFFSKSNNGTTMKISLG